MTNADDKTHAWAPDLFNMQARPNDFNVKDYKHLTDMV